MDREIGVDVKRSVNEKQRYKMIKKSVSRQLHTFL